MATDNKPPRSWRWVIGLVILPTLVGWHFLYNRLPSEIRVATGASGGLYHQFAEELKPQLETATGSRAVILETQGSNDNRQRLIDQTADLAILQVGPGSVEGVVALAPLYHDVIFVVARRGVGMNDPCDLANRSVVVGLPESGMRASAIALLEHYGLDDKSTNALNGIFWTC